LINRLHIYSWKDQMATILPAAGLVLCAVAGCCCRRIGMSRVQCRWDCSAVAWAEHVHVERASQNRR